ncbi:MAG: energy-coupling factor transporter transmembrane protein EcfT [bacterium]|nr:energy-coupling factor transporter transmembrane protein EcfT [bacterium]
MTLKVSFGHYCNVDSPIHRLDPRMKIHLFIVFLAAIFFVDTTWGVVALIAALAIVHIISKVPLKTALKAIWPMCLVCLFPLIVNLFATQGEPILTIGAYTLTDVGLHRSIFLTLRMLLILSLACELMLTTSAVEFCDATAYLLRPFSKLRFPADDVAMVFSIAIRFIPTLSEEYNSIRLAQMARGTELWKGKLSSRLRSFKAILLPLFVGAYRRAETLAQSMESRCYGTGAERTHYRQLKVRVWDFVALAIVIAVLVFAILWL